MNPSFSFEFLLISVSESFMAMSVKSYSGLHLSLPPGSKLFVLFSVSESSCSLVATWVWSTLDLLICRRFGSFNPTFFFLLPFLVEVGLRPQNAIWIFRAPRGIIFRYGNCEMVSSRRPCFYASIWKILQKKNSHFRLWTIGGEWCLLLHQPPPPFGMICFGSCNR